MITPTYHLQRAISSLDYWYDYVAWWQHMEKKWSMVKFSSLREDLAKVARRQALKCKTLGLVYHDKYKLILDK